MPIGRQFAELLRSVPESEREGFVFNPQTPRARKQNRPTRDRATCAFSHIDEKDGIVVARKPRLKHRSAHDFRLAFGIR